MSNSNPQLKQYIREQLMAKFLNEAKRQGVTKSNQQKTVPNAAVKSAVSRTTKVAGQVGNAASSAVSSGVQSVAGLAANVAGARMVGAAAKRVGAAAVPPSVPGNTTINIMPAATDASTVAAGSATDAPTVAAGSKLKAGFKNYTKTIGKVDSALLGTAAKGNVAATKGIMGNMGGKVGTAVKLGGAGIGAVLQGIDSASTEYAENIDKGMSTGENIKNTAIRGGLGAAGAGLGTWGGAAAGAAIGSVVPVVGTAIGAVVGGILGGMGGGYVGDTVGDAITNIGDNPEAIKDFQADREIKDIQRKDKVQAERQRLADEKFTKGKPADGKSSDTTTGSPMTPAPAGVDYNSTNDSNDRDQEQDFSYNNRPNQGNDVTAAGGQVNVRMRQRQRQ
jgi:hypothetical protein